MKNDPKKRVGLVGSSNYTGSLVNSLLGISNIQLVGLCEIEIDPVIAKISSKHHIPTFSDVTTLLHNVEIDWLINISNRSISQYHLLQEMHPNLTIIDSHITQLIFQTIKDFERFFDQKNQKKNNNPEYYLWKTLDNIVNLTQPIYKKLERIAFHDPLTGLYTRNIFIELLEREISRTYRQFSSIAVVTGDIDHFKNINDTFGHNTGDLVLKKLGRIFRKSCRRSDIAARYGGEEFVVVLPNTDIESAVTLCERIRVNTEKSLPLPDGKPVTISFGIVCLNSSVQSGEFTTQITPELLLGYADKMLYKAKNTGRNKVESVTINI